MASCWDCGKRRKLNTKHLCSECTRDKNLMTRYGIDTQHYNALLKKQRGACAICLTKPKGKLHVDHCHDKNVIRGLLCHHCNTALGLAKDSRKVLSRMIKYLSKCKGE